MTKRHKIFGGPGCGKTYILKDFYQKFLFEGYQTNEITVLTFRTNSAKDLLDATISYARVEEKELKKHVGTIHSICYRLIGHPELMKTEDYTDFVKLQNYGKYLKKASFGKKNYDIEESVYSGDLFDLYSWLRNTCTPVEKWKKYPGTKNITMPASKVPEFFHNYEEYKKQMSKIDFSDMLQRVIDEKIMLDTPVLMVDEFQDFTAQMYAIFKMWEASCESVLIAGDPNQSIYGFWGGSPDYFTEWEADEIMRHETFRLSDQIKNFSHKLLRSSGMTAPETKAQKAAGNTIYQVQYFTNS
jgi:superfamily I DNA/RNA helicase